MGEKMKKGFVPEWHSIQAKVEQILGEDFWQDMAEVIPNMGPRIDAYETEDEVIVIAELPGLKDLQDVQVSLHGTTLHITGALQVDYPAEAKWLLQERFTGDFSRKVTVPNILYTDVGGKYLNGLLYVVLKKSAEKQEQRIPVKFG
jgi:HSP20 family protein